MTYNSDLVTLVDERVAAAQQRDTAMGTVVTRDTSTRATVVFDGDVTAVPVKVFGTVPASPADRVGLQRYGSDWVVVGSFSTTPISTGASPVFVAEDSDTGASSSIGTSATAVLTQPVTFIAGRAYRVEVSGGYASSVAGNLAYGRLWNNTSGTLLADFYRTRCEGANVMSMDHTVVLGNLTGSDIAASLQFMIFASSGTVQHFANSARTRRMTVWDVGPTSLWTSLQPIA